MPAETSGTWWPLSRDTNYFMATLYYNNDVGNEDWSTLGNWWLDGSFSTSATHLPTSGDDVEIYGSLTSNSGSVPTVNNLTIFDNSARPGGEDGRLGTSVIVLGTATFNGHSVGQNPTAGLLPTITGNAVFNDYSFASDFTIHGKVTFNDYSHSESTLNEVEDWDLEVVFNDYSTQTAYIGSSVVHATFNDYSRNYGYIYNQTIVFNDVHATFNDYSRNYGTIYNGLIIFNDNSTNAQDLTAEQSTVNAIFNDYSYSTGTTPENTVFNDYSKNYDGVIYVDSNSGDNNNDISTLQSPYNTIQKGFVTAYHLVPKLTTVDGVKCASFNGSTDYLNVLPVEGANIREIFTVEFWFYMKSETSGSYTLLSNLFNQGSNSQTHPLWKVNICTRDSLGLSEYYGTNNVISVSRTNAGATPPVSVVGNTFSNIELNEWTHFAMVADGGVFKIYLNGNLESTYNFTGGYSFGIDEGEDFRSGLDIGYDYDNGDFFNGYISGIRIFNDAAVYTSTFTPSSPDDFGSTVGLHTASFLWNFDTPKNYLIDVKALAPQDDVYGYDAGPGRNHGEATEWPNNIALRGNNANADGSPWKEVIISEEDLQYATELGGANLLSDGFTTDGTPNVGGGGIRFIGATNLENKFLLNNSNAFSNTSLQGVYIVEWAEGSTSKKGLAYLTFTSGPNNISVYPTNDQYGTNTELVGTWKLPAKFKPASAMGNINFNGRDAVWDYAENVAITTSTNGRNIDILTYGEVSILNINSNGGGRDGGAGPGSGGEVRINNVMADNINVNGGDGVWDSPFFLSQGGGGNFTGINSNVKDIHLNPGTGGYARDGGDTKLIGSKAKNIYSHGGLSIDCGGGGSGGDLFMLNSTVGEVACYGYPGDGCGSPGSNGGYATIINSTVDWLRLNGASDGTFYGQGGNAVVIDSSIMVADVTNFGLPSEMCNDIYGHPCEGEQIPGYAVAPNHDYDGSIKTHTTKKQAINGPGFLG
jgi:Concanavalin A-like lectin/glucanases superfamily